MRTKRELRTAVIARRDALNANARAKKSAHVCTELLHTLDGLVRDGRQVVAVFSSMGSEVDLDAFVRGAYDRGARVAFPCMVKNPAWKETVPPAASPDGSSEVRQPEPSIAAHADRDKPHDETAGAPASPAHAFVPRLLMQFRAVTREQYESGAAPFVERPLRTFAPNAPELAPFPPVRPEQVDFAVCPLVAFDAAGHRLGYGGGNYDAFLSRVRPDATVVGVAFAEQEVPTGSIPLEPHDRALPRIVRA